MKILLVTQDYYPVQGGIQSYCHEVAMSLCNQGVDLTMICPGEVQESDSKLPFKVIRVKIHSSFLFLKLLRLLPKHLKEHSYDHVLFGQWQNAIGFLWKKPKGPKYHTMVHGRELLHGVFGALTPWLCAKVYRKLDSVVPNSFPIAEMFKSTVPGFSNVNVIHPGVDAQRFTPQPKSKLKEELGLSDKKLLVSVTRLVARKNISLVMKALPLVLKEEPKAHIVVGGRGPELENLKALRIQLRLEDHISILGSIEEGRLVEHFALGDIFLLPSSQSSKDVEGFGIVFLEAGACEVPVIGANTGGIKDAVVHNQTGILLEELTKEELAKAIVSLLKDSSKAKSFGKAARQRILAELTWESCGENYMDKVFN
jgi:phosphatidylinositol alpha-1,6-mannosyltransferase